MRFKGGITILEIRAVFAGALLAVALPALAQSRAAVSGTVQDDTGAGLPDAKVSVIDQATKVQKEVRSGTDGSYSIAAGPGTYSVGVEKPGRGVFAVRDIELAEGQTRIVNLQVSARAENRNFRYMFYGFLAAWMVLVIYVISLASRERGLRRQIVDLRRMVESERR